MSRPPMEFHKIWIEQCEATEDIRDRFGLADAMNYLIGEKPFSFVRASERDPDFAAELPTFVNEIRRLLPAEQIRDILHARAVASCAALRKSIIVGVYSTHPVKPFSADLASGPRRCHFLPTTLMTI